MCDKIQYFDYILSGYISINLWLAIHANKVLHKIFRHFRQVLTDPEMKSQSLLRLSLRPGGGPLTNEWPPREWDIYPAKLL